MLPPFSQDELALIARHDFLQHVSEPELAEALKKTTADARSGRSTSNRLGPGNHQLIEALERFIAACEAPSDVHVAQGLNLKLRGALEAAKRP